MRRLILASAAIATAVTGLAIAPLTAHAQVGTFQQSCRNVRSGNGMLTADCADSGGKYRSSAIAYTQCRGDIANNNGMLVCQGATATGGQVVNNNNDRDRGGDRRGDDRRDDRGNNNAGAAFLGGVLGGALAGGQPAPGPGYGPPPPGPPPGYGDQRYGDPRYDWRYAQGGWGYGRRPGEWVAIRDRADWLERRIDRAQQDGRIGRRDARDMRRQLDGIEGLEGQYLRDGRLGQRERADLDRRFNDLAERVRYEAGR